MDSVVKFEKRLDKFQQMVREITYKDEETSTEMRRQRISENLPFDQFCWKTKRIFGRNIKNQDLKPIYRKITTNPDTKVDWSEVFGYAQNTATEEKEFTGDNTVFMVTKRSRVGDATGGKMRRDTVQSIRYIQSLDSYITCTQNGVISVWTGKLRLQTFVRIQEPSWLTACEYLPGVRRVSCCTERSIVLWDSRAKGKSQNIFIIKPLEHSPQCMAIIPSENDEAEDRVLFGDDQGYVNLLTIQATDIHFKDQRNENRKPKSVYSVIEPEKLTIPILRRKLHDDWVIKVKYFPGLKCFASCSTSSSVSFVMGDFEKIFMVNEEARSVAIPKGVSCFDHCVRANIIATGGVDKIIRVWHPHIFSQPTGKLVGHLFTVIDITMNEVDQHIISLCSAGIIRVWDIHTLTCLQVFAGNDMRPGQAKMNAMIFDNMHERLLTGSNVIDAWPLTKTIQGLVQVPHTHDRAIVQVLFSKQLNQVVSVCTESTIKVWEMETGKLVYSLPDAHGPHVEVTALSLDTSGYKFASGAVNGSIKVWDCGTGQMLKAAGNRKYSSFEDSSITGIVYTKKNNECFIIASDLTSRLRMYQEGTNTLIPLREFSDMSTFSQEKMYIQIRVHGIAAKESPSSSTLDHSEVSDKSEGEEQVLTEIKMTCVSLLTCDLIATGCTNGNIILWSMEKSCIEKIFTLPKENENESMCRNHRQVNVVKLLTHKKHNLDHTHFRSSDLWMDSRSGIISRQSESAFTDKSMESQVSTEVRRTVKVTQVNRDDTSMSWYSESSSTGKIKLEEESGAETVHRELPITDQDIKTTEYEPILASVHQDCCIRLWNMNGELLRKISTNIHMDACVISLCHDDSVNILVMGYNNGYLAIWDVRKFLENPDTEDMNCMTHILSWRAHQKKIVTLVFVDSLKIILSGSTDGSIRLWWERNGQFVGFFNQYRPFCFPTTEELSGLPALPCDINERPVALIERKRILHEIQPIRRFEYPLVFDSKRWEPFQRSAYLAQRGNILRSESQKFFGALIKPKSYNTHLESFITADKESGAVFRSLPIHPVYTPDRIPTPVTSFRVSDEINAENLHRRLSEVGSQRRLAKNCKQNNLNHKFRFQFKSWNGGLGREHNKNSTETSGSSPFPHVPRKSILPPLSDGK